MKEREEEASRDHTCQPGVSPLPAVLSSCRQAISRGQLGTSPAPRLALGSADSPGTHRARTASAWEVLVQVQKDTKGSHVNQQVERGNQHARWSTPGLAALGLFQFREFNLRPSQGGGGGSLG